MAKKAEVNSRESIFPDYEKRYRDEKKTVLAKTILHLRVNFQAILSSGSSVLAANIKTCQKRPKTQGKFTENDFSGL